MATGPTPQPGSDQTPTSRAAVHRSRRERARLVAVAILAVGATLFAVLNLDKVKVNLLFGSPELPLIVVIVACLLIGAVFGTVLAARRARGGGRRG